MRIGDRDPVLARGGRHQLQDVEERLRAIEIQTVDGCRQPADLLPHRSPVIKGMAPRQPTQGGGLAGEQRRPEAIAAGRDHPAEQFLDHAEGRDEAAPLGKPRQGQRQLVQGETIRDAGASVRPGRPQSGAYRRD